MGPALVIASALAIYLYLKGSVNNAQTIPNLAFQFGKQPGINTSTGSSVATTATGPTTTGGPVTNQPNPGGSGVSPNSTSFVSYANRTPGLSIRNNQPFFGGRNASFLPRATAPTNTKSNGCSRCGGCGGGCNGGRQDGAGGCAGSPSSVCAQALRKPLGTGGPNSNAPVLTISGQFANVVSNYNETGANPFNWFQQAANQLSEDNGGEPTAAPSYIN